MIKQLCIVALLCFYSTTHSSDIKNQNIISIQSFFIQKALNNFQETTIQETLLSLAAQSNYNPLFACSNNLQLLAIHDQNIVHIYTYNDDTHAYTSLKSINTKNGTPAIAVSDNGLSIAFPTEKNKSIQILQRNGNDFDRIVLKTDLADKQTIKKIALNTDGSLCTVVNQNSKNKNSIDISIFNISTEKKLLSKANIKYFSISNDAKSLLINDGKNISFSQYLFKNRVYQPQWTSTAKPEANTQLIGELLSPDGSFIISVIKDKNQYGIIYRNAKSSTSHDEYTMTPHPNYPSDSIETIEAISETEWIIQWKSNAIFVFKFPKAAYKDYISYLDTIKFIVPNNSWMREFLYAIQNNSDKKFRIECEKNKQSKKIEEPCLFLKFGENFNALAICRNSTTQQYFIQRYTFLRQDTLDGIEAITTITSEQIELLSIMVNNQKITLTKKDMDTIESLPKTVKTLIATYLINREKLEAAKNTLQTERSIPSPEPSWPSLLSPAEKQPGSIVAEQEKPKDITPSRPSASQRYIHIATIQTSPNLLQKLTEKYKITDEELQNIRNALKPEPSTQLPATPLASQSQSQQTEQPQQPPMKTQQNRWTMNNIGNVVKNAAIATWNYVKSFFSRRF